jgi:ketosteroid isomerase-like protein
MSQNQIVSLVAAAFLVSGCAPATFDRAAEEKKLLQRDAEWADIASAGKDVDKTASYWSDDAVIIPQGQPIVEGKAAIRAFVASSFAIPGFHIHWKSEKPTFSPDGRLAYMRGANAMTVPGPDGKPMTLAGRGVTVWRLEPDGQWRCVVDTWNDPPLSAGGAETSPTGS